MIKESITSKTKQEAEVFFMNYKEYKELDRDIKHDGWTIVHKIIDELRASTSEQEEELKELLQSINERDGFPTITEIQKFNEIIAKYVINDEIPKDFSCGVHPLLSS